MKVSYILLAFIGILMYNAFLIRRDAELLKAYDQACSVLSQSHPNCRDSK